MNLKKIIVLLANKKLPKNKRNKVQTIFTQKSFEKALETLNISDKDDLLKAIKEVLSKQSFSWSIINKVNKEINKALKKDFFNKQLSTSERDILNWYARVSDIPSESEEFVKVNSGWIISAKYIKKVKQVQITTKRGRGLYTFYKVPRTKWLALVRIGGKYMWDYFGFHYSTNPNRWVRGR